MRLTLDGERFELTPALVQARLNDHVPEVVHEYWVEVDGVRWPVKQVIAIATGVSRRRFQSHASCRWLHNLGFPTGRGSAQINGVDASRSAPYMRHGVDASQLDPLESVEVTSKFTWRRAGALSLDAEGLPCFPALPREPGIYRFDFGTDDAGLRSLYIGESVSLRQRASNYRNARTDHSRQRTSRRIHQKAVAHLSAGGAIEFAIATAVVLSDGRPADLRLTSARRLAENAAVLSAQMDPGVK